jgi:hypothetical protein
MLLLATTVALAAGAPAWAQVPDLGSWDGIWMKTTVKQKGLGFRVAQPGTHKDTGGATVYVQIHFDVGTPDRLGLDVWVREDQWEKQTLTLLYVAGVADDALLVFNQVPVTPDAIVEPIGFAGSISLKGKATTKLPADLPR